MRAALPALAILAAASGAAAQTPAPAPNTVDEVVVVSPKMVEELVVTGRARCLPAAMDASRGAPRVVSAYPPRGAVVPPGLVVVRVTFDRPMTCNGYFFASPPLANPCPPYEQKMVLSFDRRTVRILCAAAPGAAYGLRLTPGPAGVFQSLGGGILEPYALSFTTSAGPQTQTVPAALALDPEFKPPARARP